MRRKITLNMNRGSTLMIVLISVAIVSILATLLISMSALSAKLKYWDKQLKQTMYYSEAGLDQIYANLSVQVENMLGEAYNNTYNIVKITDFAPTDNQVQESVNKMFKEQFVTLMKANSNFYEGGIQLDNEAMKVLLNSYISSDTSRYSEEGVPLVLQIGEIKVTSILENMENYRYVMKDVEVEFTNSTTSLRTYITTDIVIQVPNFDFPLLIQESVTTSIPIGEYALIANHNINVRGGGTANITGSIYSGGVGPVSLTDSDRAYDLHNNYGISVTGSATLNIDGLNVMVITPSWIKTNNGKIKISNAKIFCDSLVTMGTGANEISIEGSSSETFVVDDLELNADKSVVKIKGSYFGISNGAFKHNSSSSIIINGAGSTLDLGGASAVVLPGLSYFDLNPNEVANGAYDKKDENGNYIRFYATGESISMRGNHVAYFIPEGYSINPEVTTGYDDFFDDFFDDEVKSTIVPEYYTNGSVAMLNISKLDRADYFYNYVTNMNIYRLNEVKFTGFGTTDEEKMNIILKEASLITQGAVIATKLIKENGSQITNEVVPKYGIASDFTGLEAIARINKFNWAVRTGKLLSNTDAEATPPILTTASLISRYINDDTINLWNEGFNKVSDQCVSFVSSNNITISTTSISSSGSSKEYRSKGIIVSGGDIVIEAGVKFEGLIIAGGTITIIGDVNITASEKAISDTFASNWKLKQTIFKDVTTNLDPQIEYIGSAQTNTKGRFAELINFENWTKNKE